ncbi:RNA helicase [Bradyrhizobium sp.]|uniref:RNA helicase n=1 Tax=Bradyrhizobium sp. TaxID=376 RepID=UPI002D2B4BDB|nr:RNA helicase [Bradyrhizobium sp.]HZR75123.1 RNA helicase [Bradyrhizobium sp.]
MIEILGVLEGQEYEAAVHVRRLLLKLWPDLAQSREDIVKIFVGFKMYGYKVEDLDLIVIGQLAAPRSFDVEWKFYPRDAEPFVPRTASVRNFALVMEVKSHDASGVRFAGKVASVRYIRNGRATWECVTEKNRLQMFEFKKYLGRHGVDQIHVQDLILFTGLRESDLPKRPHNCLGGDASFERVLNVLGQIARPYRNGNRVDLVFGAIDAFERILSTKFELFDTLEPTPLDRRRMDMIAKGGMSDAWLDDLGERQVILRGRGGVGKTVILLQMAYRAYEMRQQRSLLLTFNKALVADLRRTMALLGVPRSLESGGIAIDTVHAFFGRVMRQLGIIDSYEGFLDRFVEHKEALLDYLRSGAVSRGDLDTLMKQHGAEFDWDLVFVDEAQDWPADEIAILRHLYGPERLVVSDGIDQYVRESVADWSQGVSRTSLRARRLTRCMRMKANLAAFVSDMASSLRIDDWDLEPNTDAPGGRVIVVEGDLASRPDLLQGWCNDASALGNAPVDMLACLPPTLIEPKQSGQLCWPALHYERSGGSVWDGTSRDVREHFPTHRDQLRFVQYDSCRGLEGWIVINYQLDTLWDYKHGQWFSEGHIVDDLYRTAEDAALQHASRWVMIPLTRAIDTLVINITGQSGFVPDALRRVHEKRRDFVDWIVLT